jgi:C4-type Zn-finger protein
MGMRMGKDEERKNGQELIDRITKLIEGQEKVCVIFEDPLGYSAIASDKAIIESLSEEEIKNLKFGESPFEIKRDNC